METILGYALAFVMGLTLGLIGAGGSILTVPILVYLLDVKPVTATGYSLLVVGSAAFVGAIGYSRQGKVDLRAALTFAVPAMLMVLLTRSYIVPILPDPMLIVSTTAVSKDTFIMLLFVCLMLAAALFMLKPSKAVKGISQKPPMTTLRVVRLVTGSAGVGLLTGMVGAGGGFLIIPTLIVLFGLEMKQAIGTSLAIIATNSLVGFGGDIAAGISLDWQLLGLFLGLTLLGMWLGVSMSNRVNGAKLKQLFGLFTLLVAVAVLAEELYTLIGHK